LNAAQAGTRSALWFPVSGGSVDRRRRGLEPDFSRGGTGVQAGKLERVGSLIPGKPTRAAERRRGPAARGSSRQRSRAEGMRRHSQAARGEHPEEQEAHEGRGSAGT